MDLGCNEEVCFVVDKVNRETALPVARENVAREANNMTDEAWWYRPLGAEFASHQAVEHSKDQYVHGNAHAYTVEGFFSIFKRGMKGVCQHCGKRHLHRYVAEFDFCYSNRVANGVGDQMRTRIALNGVVGKRVLYRESLGA